MEINPVILLLKIDGLDINRVTISNALGMCPATLNGAHLLTNHAKAFKRLYFLTGLKMTDVKENELLDYYRSVIRWVVEYACPAWSTGITKGQSESLEHLPKRALNIILAHMQYKEVITKFNLPIIKDHFNILNSNLFRNIVDNESHRLHYILPKHHLTKILLPIPQPQHRTKYEPLKY